MNTRFLRPSTAAAAAVLFSGPLALQATAQQTTPVPPPTIVDDYLLTAQGNRDGGLTTTRTIGRDPGGRLTRLRSGVPRWEKETTMAPPPVVDSKGGMAKGGMAKEPIVMTERACWEVYGGLFYYTEDYDQQFVLTRLGGGPQTAPVPVRVLVRANTEIDVFGGVIGADRCVGDNWRVGLALAGANTDMDLSIGGLNIASNDIDTFSAMPYVSYYQEDALGTADFWADFMYGYSDHSYDMRVLGGLLSASPDGSAHTLDFNTGINFDAGRVVHGPHVGLRYIDGEIDGYTVFPLAVFVPGTDYTSLVSTVGYHVALPIDVGSGKIVPQLSVGWEHEFDDDADTLFGLPLAGKDEDVIVAGAGVGFYCLQTGWNAGLNYEGRFGDESEGHYVGLRVGKEF